MSSIIFNPAMLTASPSPSPEPEERPQDSGDTSTNDATLDNTASKEPEESIVDQIDRAWAAVLNTMHVCIDTSPPSKPELLEEQESWLHDWNIAMSDMTSVFYRAHAVGMHLSLNDVDAVMLAEGKIAAWTLMRAVKTWKEKVEESAVTARPVRTEKGKAKEVVASKKTAEKATEKSGEKAPKPVLTDMGRLRLGGWMTATSVSRPAERSERKVRGCVKAQKGCSFVATKNKGCAPAVPKRKVPPSAQTTAPDASESEVEIIVMQQPKWPLASTAEPVVKRPCLDADTELEEARAESTQLCAENAELHTRNDKYCLALLDMRQHTRTQESELLHMSNRLYILARDWGNWEKELGEILEE
ncbi:uncharacterized protein F5147DRAFT_771399 [Suillus discolor]|uniref:Uncharacterized protein n=1 Tax=Suillus discolor TaxID=1912936 RepID=A0A9P7FCP3_9AGAM|nr:uncharacterized protein F5147DRAFT_771399 [Suillus discolor]KAG2112336.1 hypothetical protein F5147DRAFT_771399 [Suillus discolor]